MFCYWVYLSCSSNQCYAFPRRVQITYNTLYHLRKAGRTVQSFFAAWFQVYISIVQFMILYIMIWIIYVPCDIVHRLATLHHRMDLGVRCSRVECHHMLLLLIP